MAGGGGSLRGAGLAGGGPAGGDGQHREGQQAGRRQTAPSGPAYAAAKGGISALVRILAYELAADGVRCVTVTPGAINTQMMLRALAKRGLTTMTMPNGALARVGEPVEVANLIRFLVSDDASYITGSNVTIDGGVTPF